MPRAYYTLPVYNTSMRYLIFGDIHGNIHALQAVLEAVKDTHFDAVIGTGDYISGLPGSHQVISSLQDLASTYQFFAVQGNHEETLLELRQQHRPAWHADSRYAHIWAAEQELTDQDIAWLRTLPPQYIVGRPGEPTVLVTHRRIDDFTYNCQIYGHTHLPTWQTDKYTYLNPGSVGLGFTNQARAEYAFLELNNDGRRVELLSVDYDRTAALKSLRRSPLRHSQLRFDQMVAKSIKESADWVRLYPKMVRQLAAKGGYTSLDDAPLRYWHYVREHILANQPLKELINDLG